MDNSFKLPAEVATCPECGGALQVEVTEWIEATGIPTESGMVVLCQQAEDEFGKWMDESGKYSPMPESHEYRHSDWESEIQRATKYAIQFCRVKDTTKNKE